MIRMNLIIIKFLCILLTIFFLEESHALEYIVRPGDTLSKIAKQYYGRYSEWEKIYELNRDQISNPNLVYAGQKIKLPQGPVTSTPIPAEGKFSTSKMIEEALNILKASISQIDPGSNDEIKKLRILFFGGLEGQLMPAQNRKKQKVGGLLFLDAVAQKYRTSQSLFVSVGDDMQGTLLANYFQGSSVIESYNTIGLDTMNIGNHEFDFGQAVLNELRKIAKFPILSANILGASPPFQSHVVKEIGGLSIAIVGAIDPTAPSKIHPKHIQGLQFIKPFEPLQKLISQLNQQHDLVIVLSELVPPQNLVLANTVPGIDIIIEHYQKNRVSQEKVKDTLLFRLEDYKGKQLGVLDLSINNRRVVEYKFQKINVSEKELSAQNTTVRSELQTYLEIKERDVLNRMSDTIARTTTHLEGEKATIRFQETNLGNLIADGMLELMEFAQPDAAVVNAGSIRTSIPAGNITVRDVYKVLPFDNTLDVIKITGAELQAALENSVSKYGEQSGAGRFLQVSRIFYRFDPSRPVGSRILESKIANEPIDPARTYRLVINDYLRSGADDYLMLSKDPVVSNGNMVRDLMVDLLAEKQTVSPSVEGRIVKAQ